MRNESEIKKLIVDFATNDKRVHAVVLNGSRANANIQRDSLQDYDIVFIVNSIESFVNDNHWTGCLGEKLICQMPDRMTFGKKVSEWHRDTPFAYLMLFMDMNRIDLTLFPIERFETDFVLDSLTIVWFDPGDLFIHAPGPSDRNYFVAKPNEKEFLDTCNEFWWVSTYVAKGLVRNEITYAKEMLETFVRPMFMNMIAWKIGSEHDFSVSIGKAGKLISKYLTKKEYETVLQTYSGSDIEQNWKSLFIMTEMFKQISCQVSRMFQFKHEEEEQDNTLMYLKALYDRRNISSH